MMGKGIKVLPEADKTGYPEWPKVEMRHGNRMGSGGVKKFVAIDLCGDAGAAVLRGLDADDLTVTADVDVIGSSNLLGKGDYEIDGAANLEICLGQKIKSTVTDIAGLPGQFLRLRVLQQKSNGQSHVEAASFAAVGSVGHGTPEGIGNCQTVSFTQAKLQRKTGAI
jgi:hypothetical protein